MNKEVRQLNYLKSCYYGNYTRKGVAVLRDELSELKSIKDSFESRLDILLEKKKSILKYEIMNNVRGLTSDVDNQIKKLAEDFHKTSNAVKLSKKIERLELALKSGLIELIESRRGISSQVLNKSPEDGWAFHGSKDVFDIQLLLLSERAFGRDFFDKHYKA